MTEDELMDIARGVARQRLAVENLGMMNTPSDIEERVKSDARYMVEMDKLRIMEKGYQAALRQTTVWGTSTQPG